MLKCGFRGRAIITSIHFAGCWQRMHIMCRRARERHHAWMRAGFSRRLENPCTGQSQQFLSSAYMLLTAWQHMYPSFFTCSRSRILNRTFAALALSTSLCLGAVCPASCPCFFLILLFFFFLWTSSSSGKEKNNFFPEQSLNLQSQILTETVLLSWFNVVSNYYSGLSSFNSWNSLQRCQPLGCSPERPLVILLMPIHANVVFPYLPYLNCIIMAYDKDCLQSAQATCKNWLSC